jgi:hypothetical protein
MYFGFGVTIGSILEFGRSAMKVYALYGVERKNVLAHSCK